MNTNTNIRFEDGQLIQLNERMIANFPVLGQPSIIDRISNPTGQGFFTGDITKMVRRKQVDSKVNRAKGGVGGYVGASSQYLFKVRTGKQIREDNIVYSESDIKKLQEGKGGDITALEVGNFILTGREMDLKWLLNDAKAKALNHKLHTAFDANGAPTGVQPASGGTSFDHGIADIRNGRRVIKLAFNDTAGNVDEKIDGRAKILREAISYLSTIGTERNPKEKEYLFSINGIALERIKILTTYIDNLQIKDKDTQRYISVNNNLQANITGIVGHLDNGVKIMMTNQSPSKTKYIVSSDRVFVRDLDPSQQYIGSVRNSATVKMADGSVENLKPNERLLQFYQARIMATVYHEEIFYIDEN